LVIRKIMYLVTSKQLISIFEFVVDKIQVMFDLECSELQNTGHV